MAKLSESIIRDILDVKDAVMDGSIKVNIKTQNSIAKEANSGILQFPLLTSTALSLSETTMIAKALEREYVSFVAIMTSVKSVTDAKSVEDFLRGIHQNSPYTGLAGSLRESAIYRNPIVNTELMERLKESETATVEILKNTESSDDFKEFDRSSIVPVSPSELSQEDKERLDSIVCSKMTNGTCFGKAFKYPANSAINSVVLDTGKDSYTQILPLTNMTGDVIFVETELCNAKARTFIAESVFNSISSYSNRMLSEYVPDLNYKSLNEMTTSNKNLLIAGDKYLVGKYDPLNRGGILSEANDIASETNKDFTRLPSANSVERGDSVLKNILSDNDVKKANELVPTMMHLKTYFKTEDGSLQAVDYMIGIKSVVHPIKSDSMVENLARGTKRGKFFFNLLKLTSGEISFFKDFLFAVNSTKDDIKTKYKDNSWWVALLRRRKMHNVLKLLNRKDQLVPNATIVMTMDEVEKIKAEYGINLMDKKYVLDLIKTYFLLGFVIVDSSIEVAYFLFDGQTNFQQYGFTALERENSNSAKEVKNIMQVLGRI